VTSRQPSDRESRRPQSRPKKPLRKNGCPEAKVSEIRSVKGAKVLGTRAGNWLTRAQAEKLQSLPDIETLKGKRDRVLLALFVSAGLRQQAVAVWLEAMPIKEGPVLGKVNKGGRSVGAGISAPSIYSVVVEYAERLGVEFRPHDLRRTYGKLAHKAGARIEQIQLSYGHASLTTTERYLGVEQDLEDAPCDHLGLTPG
jgi:site-specific recombinase XerD